MTQTMSKLFRCHGQVYNFNHDRVMDIVFASINHIKLDKIYEATILRSGVVESLWRKKNVKDVFSLHSRFLYEDIFKNVTQRSELKHKPEALPTGESRNQSLAAQGLKFVDWGIRDKGLCRVGVLEVSLRFHLVFS